MLRDISLAGAQTHWFAGGRDDQPIDSWLKQELAREYEATLQEKLPQEWLDLLREEMPVRH